MKINELLKSIDMMRITTNETLAAGRIPHNEAMEHLAHLDTLIDTIEICNKWADEQRQYPDTREGLYGSAVLTLCAKELLSFVENRVQTLKDGL